MIRAILALVPSQKWKVRQVDVKGAYLNGTLEECVYMQQPEGFGDGTGQICLLVKTLYGLKQSGRRWNIELDTKLKGHGFKRILLDPCVYVCHDQTGMAIITVWVDDLLLFASSEEAMNKMVNQIKSEWQIMDLEEPQKIVSIEITMKDHAVTISQKKYIETILKKEGMEKLNPVSMLMDLNETFEPNPDEEEGNRSNPYARLLGELQFLSNATRPDIMFVVNKLASYTTNPSLKHISAIKRILCYLAGTKDYSITYMDFTTHPNIFYRYADAAFEGDSKDHKSTAGYIFITGNGAITWRSKKQTIIALSTTEAEYVVLSEAS